jgi:hypothetical protein
MTWVVLAARGVPLWLVIAALAASLWSRRTFKRPPGTFPCFQRAPAPVTAVPTRFDSPSTQVCLRATS